MAKDKFEQIRSYRDSEFPVVRDRLLQHPALKQVIDYLSIGYSYEDFANKFKSLASIDDFQKEIIYPVLVKIVRETCSSFTIGGLNNLALDKNYLFISNHRDIVSDPFLINGAFFENAFPTTEIAIGDNLVSIDWVSDLMKLNKSFIVRRNLPARELVLASKLLSEYIHDSVMNRHESVWIAQREGRARDGNDKTQQGLINMLALASGESFRQGIKNLNIVPVSISYEKDPCEISKVRSLYIERKVGKYIKAKGEDIESMKKGILGHKGNVHIHFGDPVNDVLDEIPEEMHKTQFFSGIRSIIDYRIIEGYKLRKRNYMAYDILNNAGDYADYYTPEERKAFMEEVREKAAQIEGPVEEIIPIFYEVYAKPLHNKENLPATHELTVPKNSYVDR